MAESGKRNAIFSLLKRDDLLAVLPPGYGKSLFFQLFAVAALLEMEEQQTVLVVCPLKSIIKDQITEAQRMEILVLQLQMYPTKNYQLPIFSG